MSFNDKIANITKRPVNYITLQLDYCTRTFGVSPCLATGTKCFNTYPTCKYVAAFNKTTKDYDICSNHAPISMAAELNAKPYLQSEQYLPTELREDKTIPARATFTILDEPDTDVGIDPYLNDRTYDILDRQGTFVKKLLARNPNYKHRPVKSYQGFEGLDKADYVQRFRGKIENITRSGNAAKIECIDLLKSLDDYKYPIKLNSKITEDMGAFFECDNEEKMLELTEARENDYACRKDFWYLHVESSISGGGTLEGQYFYRVVAYDVYGNAFAASQLIQFDTTETYNQLTLDWSTAFNDYIHSNASYYRIFGNTAAQNYYKQQTGQTLTDDGQNIFTVSGMSETEAYRLYKLTLEDPTSKNSWTVDFSGIDVGLTETTKLDAAGYIKIEDEIISYTSKDSSKIYGIKRAQGKSKGDERHYAGTNIAYVIAKSAQNPFDILTDLFSKADITTDFYESAKIAAYKAAYTGIDFSTSPIFKDSTLGKLAADLVNVLDGKIWQNENGKLDFKYNSESTVSATISDAENIIVDSTGVDDGMEDIKTRLLCFYDRYDATKAATDKENYNGLWIEIDADAESANMYNEELPQEFTTTWINADCGTATEIKAYLTTILHNKLKRKRVPRPTLQCDVELKDSNILVGQLVYLNSDEFNNIDGTDYSNEIFEVIKKEPKGSRITLWVQLWPNDEITTSNEDHSQILENPIPVTKTTLNEIEVTNLKYVDAEGVEYSGTSLDINLSNVGKLKWDNMYMSEAVTATDILGVTRQLAKRWKYIGYPPAPYKEETDLSSWKLTRAYNIYLGILNTGQTAFVTARPTSNDANGKWYKVAIIPDLKINDATKKYIFEYRLPSSLIGKRIAFAVYADARLVYDPDAPVRVDLVAVQ